jgi:hypothetical protein
MLAGARPGRPDHGSERAGGAAAAADDLAHVVGRHVERQEGAAIVVALGDLDRVGIVDDLADDELEDLLHEVPELAFVAFLASWNFSHTPTFVMRTRTVLLG